MYLNQLWKQKILYFYDNKYHWNVKAPRFKCAHCLGIGRLHGMFWTLKEIPSHRWTLKDVKFLSATRGLPWFKPLKSIEENAQHQRFHSNTKETHSGCSFPSLLFAPTYVPHLSVLPYANDSHHYCLPLEKKKHISNGQRCRRRWERTPALPGPPR